MMLLGSGNAALDDFDPLGFIKRSHLDNQTTGQTRAHPLVKAFEIRRRTVGGHNHLPTGIDQGIEGVRKFLLDRLALQKLHIVDDQNINAAQTLFESQSGLRVMNPFTSCRRIKGRLAP